MFYITVTNAIRLLVFLTSSKDARLQMKKYIKWKTLVMVHYNINNKEYLFNVFQSPFLKH